MLLWLNMWYFVTMHNFDLIYTKVYNTLTYYTVAIHLIRKLNDILKDQ